MSDEERKAKRLMKAKKLEDSDEVCGENGSMYRWFPALMVPCIDGPCIDGSLYRWFMPHVGLCSCRIKPNLMSIIAIE